MSPHRDEPGRPWHLYLLGLAAIAVAVLAVVEIGPPSSSARTSRELVTAEPGVVQSTVTGTGNVQAGTDVDANFRASGTLSAVYVSVGQHVTAGQLMATLNPTVAQLTLDQAEQNLAAAQDQLTAIENGTAGSSAGAGGAGASGSDSSAASGSGSTASTGATAAVFAPGSSSTEFAAYRPGSGRPHSTTTSSSTTTTSSTTSTSTPQSAKPSRPSGGYPSNGASSSSNESSPQRSSPSRSSGSGTGGGAQGGSTARATTTTTTSTTTTPSPASIASAQASVYAAQASVQNAQTALANTKLYAPASGTIVSLANLSPGDTVSAGSNSS
ncbi:MAG: biotin/lipoyl-binding protein, partial [Solirubrobacterales bacterium]|nr:biotin/lipoyl-binding protein [Solirubrobacterales bacterium]